MAVTERQATLSQVFSYGIVYLHFYEIKIMFMLYIFSTRRQDSYI